MKKTAFIIKSILFAIFILVSNRTMAQDTIAASSEVKKAVVFLKGAQVSRIAKCYLEKGLNLIQFIKISSKVDEKSILVKSDSIVSIQSVNFSLNYLDSLIRKHKIKSLISDSLTIYNEQLKTESKLYVLQQELDLLKTNQVLSGEKRIINTEELKNAGAYFRKRITEIIILTNEANTQLKQLVAKKYKIKNQLTELNSKKEKAVGEIWVVAWARNSGEQEFSIEYFISDAGWNPKYDIRTKAVNMPSVLSYKADVFQNTDDDWTNVELILSSSNPSLGGTKPVLKSWQLDLNSEYDYSSNSYYHSNKQEVKKYQDNSDYQNSIAYYQGLVNNFSDPIEINTEMTISGTVGSSDDGYALPGVSIMVKGFSNYGTISDLDGNYSLKVPKGAQELVFSFIGMQSLELPITCQVVNCALENEDVGLDEIVVTAYGVSREERSKSYASTTLVSDGLGGFINSSLAGSAAGVSIKRAHKSPKQKKRLISKTLVGLNSVKENQTSVEFTLDKPYTIPSDNKNYSVDIEKYEIPVNYQYSSVPKMEESAFLLAQLTDWERLNLLSGSVNIYFKGSFVGNSALDVENISDTLDFSLGRDKEIMIERKLNKDKSKEQILSKWEIKSYSWEITIRNNKAEKIKVNIEDQIPLSYSKDLQVALTEQDGAKYNDNKGELSWEVALEPLEKRVLQYTYEIRCKK